MHEFSGTSFWNLFPIAYARLPMRIASKQQIPSTRDRIRVASHKVGNWISDTQQPQYS